MKKRYLEDLKTMISGYPIGSRGHEVLRVAYTALGGDMKPWVLGEAGASSKPDTGEILNMVSTMDSESIRSLVARIWLLYDDAVLRETGKLRKDSHWEDHL